MRADGAAHPHVAAPPGRSRPEFARALGIPVANPRQYEINHHMPPPALRVTLKVITQEREVIARALEKVV